MKEDLTHQATAEEIDDATERRIRRLTAILVLGVACLAFAVSFEAIRDYAASSGAVAPQLAWVIPLLVDTFIVVASLAIWLRSLDGERAWLPMALLISAACGSLLLNVAHAPHRLAAQAVSAIPPAALIASFHVAMSELRRSHKRKREAAARMAALQAMANGPGPGLTATRSTTAMFGSPTAPGQLMRPLQARAPEPRELVRHLWEEHELRGGESLTSAAVERMSGGQISRRRAQNYLRSLRAEHRNATRQDDGGPATQETAALPGPANGDKNGQAQAESVFGGPRR
jgi:uncharacterized protein DUF2637